MTEIFYLEDDEAIAATVKEYLIGKGFAVSLFGTLKEGRQALECRTPDLVLLDWNMPDGGGAGFCKWMRSIWKELPVMLLTVRDDTRDIVSGFGNGVDDYVTKPFELEVLHSRITALLRRTKGTQSRHLSCGPINVDTDAAAVFCRGEEVALSRAEYQLLLLFMQNKGKTMTRERLLEQIWDSSGNYVNDNTLTVTVKRLREKLGFPSCIKTIRSFGYRMEDET